VAGSPEGLEASFSSGIVSAVREGAGLIQTDAAISPGSSGGPVVNRRGEVIGVTASTLVVGQNLNFAVPVHFLDDLTSDSSYVLTVESIGRLAVTDSENEGFHGSVKSFEETVAYYSYSSESNTYKEGPALISSTEKFNPEGRLEKQEDQYFNGVAVGGKSLWEYSQDGLIRRYANLDTQRKTGEGWDYTSFSVHEAIDAYGGRIHFDETVDSGVKGAPSYSQSKYDGMGNETEFSLPAIGDKLVMKYNARGWLTEQLKYRQRKLYSSDRFTYETNTHGDWVKKHDAQWLAILPSLGYTPYSEDYREIKYYSQ